MTLDGGRLLGLGAAGLDHVRIDRPLGEPPRIRKFLGLGLEYLDELTADDLAFLLGIAHARKMPHELGRRGLTFACKRPANMSITIWPSLSRSNP